MESENIQPTQSPTVARAPANCPMAVQAEPPSKLRLRLLAIAEMIDAFRIIPRLILTIYGVLMYNLYHWLTDMTTIAQKQCDAAVLQLLLDHGEKLLQAESVACTIVDMVGGPTMSQAAFVTTIIGLATPLFAFYVSTGKKWGDK